MCNDLCVIGGIQIGQWYWVKGCESWLACVVYIGSNYVELTGLENGPNQSSFRVHLNEWEEYIGEEELDPKTYIDAKILDHQHKVSELLQEIKALTSSLGLTPNRLSDGQKSTDLVEMYKIDDVTNHKNALIKAKTETLPSLFKKMEKEHKMLSAWMKATLIPMYAESKVLKRSAERIEDKIFSVELYAGLTENVTQIQKGEVAGNDEKIHLFQRRHYMDEECLVNYQAGGMEFENIEAFDTWLLKKENRERILPFPKCVVAFRVRRYKKERDAATLNEFIHFLNLSAMDKKTFLYMRNGDNYYRLDTSIDFGQQLFPDSQYTEQLSAGKLYTNSRGDRPITENQYLDLEIEDKHIHWHFESVSNYVEVTPETVYYDDAMSHIHKDISQQNKIATVIQGLLDRSVVFSPHPPWKLWTPEGFMLGISLHYEDSRGISEGAGPDFMDYFNKLNAKITKGSHTIGQENLWEKHEAIKENARCDQTSYRRDSYERFRPYGNPGPGKIGQVKSISRDKSKATFQWERERQMTKWVPNPSRPGYEMIDDSTISTKFSCLVSELFNVDAYTPGDYLKFYADPRTRKDYLEWAPYLLTAEDWYAE